MKEIVLATNNQGKVNEFMHLFADLDIHFIPQSQYSLPSIEETGLTYVENAIIKARFASSQTKKPALADDSGLEIDALNGEPGIHTARYAGVQGDFKKNIEKVLTKMKGIPMQERTARVHAMLVLLRHPKDAAPLICHGIWECYISEAPRGNKGFGFDPIIYLPEFDCTAGEMDHQLKNTISHRAKSAELFCSALSGAVAFT